MIFPKQLLSKTRSLGSKGLLSNFEVRSRNRFCSYIQGQAPEPRVREYFYYIDHQGMLFLDDTKIKNFTSCFKDKQFLVFFFRRLRLNNTGRYSQDFPFVSFCGRERNFVRCDDLPIVFTHVFEKIDTTHQTTEERFSYCHAGELLTVSFEPRKIFMNPATGRVYHPAPNLVGGIGLVKSSLAIEFSSLFTFDNGEEHGPTQFLWRDKKYDLDTEWYKDKSLKLSYKL